MVDYNEMYPDLSEVKQTGENFRLNKVNMVLSQLGAEVKHYKNVRKKYCKIRGILHKTAVTTGVLSVILTASGISTALTGPGVLIGIPLSGVGGLLGLITASCTIFTKKLTKKITKHENTIQLAKSKEDSICDLVSKALSDNKIDEKEFEYIMSELKKYEKLKNDIRVKQNKVFLKNNVPDVQKLREELKKEIVDQLINPKK